MNIGDIFNAVLLHPVINLLVLIYKALETIGVPGALGFSVMVLTIIIRLGVWPFMTSQLKSTKKMAELKPHLDELKKKHATDKQALAQAQMALYKEHGVNPAGGCLPALIQIPIFIALYQSITNVLPGLGGNLDYINSILYFPWQYLSSQPNPYFLGLDLGIKPSDFASSGIFLLAIPLVTAVLTFVQSKMTLPKPVKPYPSDTTKEVKEKEGMEDTMASVQTQMMYMMPLMIGYFSFTFPVGLAIYWNTYTIIGIVQQYLISGWGGLSDWVNIFAGRKNEDLSNSLDRGIIHQNINIKKGNKKKK